MKFNIKVVDNPQPVPAPIADRLNNPLGSDAPVAKSAGFGEDSGGHYYGYGQLKDGTMGWFPLYQENKDFTLREARKVQASGGVAVPSVTTVMGCLAKPQLERWKMANAAEAMYDSLTAPAINRPEKGIAVDTAVNTASGASHGAMNLGTKIHKAIEDCMKGHDYDATLQPYVGEVLAGRLAHRITETNPEECLGSVKYGYAGRCDDNVNTASSPMTIIDYKSRKSKGKKVASYETDRMQLAAYGYAKWGNDFFKRGRGLIFAISTTTPGLVTVHEFSGPSLVSAFKAFLALCDVWRFQNDYDPRPASATITAAQAVTNAELQRQVA